MFWSLKSTPSSSAKTRYRETNTSCSVCSRAVQQTRWRILSTTRVGESLAAVFRKEKLDAAAHGGARNQTYTKK